MSILDLPIVDVDAHWTEAPDLWTSRAPADLKDRVPHVEAIRGRDHWVVDDRIVLAPVGFSVIRRDGTKAYETISLASFAEFSESSYVPKERVKLMDQYRIRAQIQYPNALGLGGGKIMRIGDLRLRSFCIQAYNDACAEIQEESGNRLFPQALLPIWDVQAALKELERSRAMGLTGCVLTDKPDDWGLPPLNDPHWDPLWDSLQGLNVPVNFHIGGGAENADHGVWPRTSYPQQMATLSIILFLNNVKIMVNCMFSGLLDRFPRLKFVSIESGVGWVPFVLEAAEYQFDQWFGERKPVQRRPREYFRDNLFCSWWFEEEDLLRNIALLGEDNVMFETDFPHPTCLYPDVDGPLQRALSGASDELQRKLLYENARRVYQLPIAPVP